MGCLLICSQHRNVVPGNKFSSEITWNQQPSPYSLIRPGRRYPCLHDHVIVHAIHVVLVEANAQRQLVQWRTGRIANRHSQSNALARRAIYLTLRRNSHAIRKNL